MRIQHNIMAMNAYRNYNTNTSALSKNLEKLSSGYKINRAGDDAAGLAISEKMRAQITGLNAAQKNVKDGISLVKTAEGAMQEIQDMLNRMDYLATQSANGTYDNEVDRNNLQKEVDALKEEIDRIADSANFNGIKLLDGTQKATAAVGASTKTETTAGESRILSSRWDGTGDPWTVVGSKSIMDSTDKAAQKASFQVDLNNLKFDVDKSGMGTASQSTATVAVKNFSITIGGKTFAASGTNTSYQYNVSSSGVASVDTSNFTATNIAKDIVAKIQGTASSAVTSINGVNWTVTETGGKLIFAQKDDPTTASKARADFDVKVSWTTDSTATNGKVTMSGTIKGGTEVTQVGNAKITGAKANTVFEVKASDIVDGAQITIGTKTVTLAVGEKSKAYKAGDNTIVDLRTLGSTIGSKELMTALSAISKTFGSNVGGTVKNANGTATATLNVGVSDGKNGVKIGLTVQRTDDSATNGVIYDNSDEGLKKLASEFKITKTIAVAAQDAKSGLTLQIGDTADSFNQLSVDIGDLHVKAMGTGSYIDENGVKQTVTKTIKDISIAKQSGAQEAIQVIKNAINYVSSIRGDLGAVQNRLEHTANNLSVMAENIQDAESTIRDTDVAEEMMAYTKNNILIQSAQAMLAQANAVPQGVLQLLG